MLVYDGRIKYLGNLPPNEDTRKGTFEFNSLKIKLVKKIKNKKK